MDDLRNAAQDLGHWLSRAEALLAEKDEDGSPGAVSSATSRAPWNGEVAAALLTAHAGIRELEADLRYEATGTSRRLSDRAGNTGSVLAAIVALGNGVSPQSRRHAIRDLTLWSVRIRQLPAVDDALRWERIRPDADRDPPVCPWCEAYSLKVAVSAGMVCCFNPSCRTEDGERPTGRLELSCIDGSPVLVWS